MGMREKIHEIIFGAETPAGALFDIALLIAIVLSVVVICLQTVDVPEMDEWKPLLAGMHWFFTILFTAEYVLRVYCVRRSLAYIFSFWGIVDLLSFLPEYLLLVPGLKRTSVFSVIRSLRLLRAFRIFKLGWFQAEADDLADAIWRARAKIVVFLTAVLIIVTVTGTLMYEIENATMGEESMFKSIPEGIYWAIVTMTTVGFGDIVPRSIAGKFLSSCLILLGYSLIIVPTGFISAEVIESKRKLLSARACASCVSEGHDSDAHYCKYCGDPL
jgi:voltage-gated potassium channel